MPHELTERIIKDSGSLFAQGEDTLVNKIITAYMKERALWLYDKRSGEQISPKTEGFIWLKKDIINQAFGIEKKSVVEKLMDFHREHYKAFSQQEFWKDYAQIAKQHYIENPEELK